MNTQPLDQPASVSRLHEWRQQGSVSLDVFTTCMARLRSVEVWRRWGALCFMILGTALLVCGVVFFFAWNWQAMERWQRLGLAAVGVLIPALGSQWLGLQALSGKLALLGSCMMTGVFLAVFGQEYQTGADAYGLFVGWAVLILPWVLCATFEPLWLIWLVIVSLGYSLHWGQVLAYKPTETPWTYVPIGLSLLYALALAAKESFAARGATWLQPLWSRWTLLFLALAPATMVAVIFVCFPDHAIRDHYFIGFLIWAAITGGSFWVYRYKLKDTAAMSLPVISTGIVVVSFAIHLIWKVLILADESSAILGGFFLYTGVIGVMVAGWVALLKKLTLQMQTELGSVERLPPPLPNDQAQNGPLTWRTVLSDVPEELRADVQNHVSQLASKPSESMWLKVVSAVAGWIAAWCFMPMLFFVLGVFYEHDSSMAMMVSGGIFLIASVLLSRVLPPMIFTEQLNLAIALGAFSLLNAGYLSQKQEPSIGSFALLQCIIALISYVWYRSSAYRFIVSAWAIGCVVGWQASLEGTSNDHVPEIIAVLAISTTALWAWRTRPLILNPLSYAVAFSLAASVLFYTLVRDFRWLSLGGSTGLAAVMLLFSLLGLVSLLNRGLQSLLSPWCIGLALITLPLVYFGELGVLTAMLLAAAAYAWGDRLLGVFAWAFLAAFLFLFYYHMAVPLSMKAFVIGGTGLVFLLARQALLHSTSKAPLAS
jgi:uncharacterized membrane protein